MKVKEKEQVKAKKAQKILAKFEKNLKYTLTSVSFTGTALPTMADCKS